MFLTANKNNNDERPTTLEENDIWYTYIAPRPSETTKNWPREGPAVTVTAFLGHFLENGLEPMG